MTYPHKFEPCCQKMRNALRDDLIRRTDRYGALHLTPPETGCTDPGISYCPFCGRAVDPYLREKEDEERRWLAARYAAEEAAAGGAF